MHYVTRYLLIGLLVCGASLLNLKSAHARSAEEVKAAYIYHFLKFVQWPENIERLRMTVCILDDEPMAQKLKPLSGQSVRSLPILLLPLTSSDPGAAARIAECDAVFIGTEGAPRLLQILNWLNNRPTLVLSDIDEFAQKGGMVEFVNFGDVIRFNINNKNARDARLFISSKLLELAHQVIQ